MQAEAGGKFPAGLELRPRAVPTSSPAKIRVGTRQLKSQHANRLGVRLSCEPSLADVCDIGHVDRRFDHCRAMLTSVAATSANLGRMLSTPLDQCRPKSSHVGGISPILPCPVSGQISTEALAGAHRHPRVQRHRSGPGDVARLRTESGRLWRVRGYASGVGRAGRRRTELRPRIAIDETERVRHTSRWEMCVKERARA